MRVYVRCSGRRLSACVESVGGHARAVWRRWLRHACAACTDVRLGYRVSGLVAYVRVKSARSACLRVVRWSLLLLAAAWGIKTCTRPGRLSTCVESGGPGLRMMVIQSKQNFGKLDEETLIFDHVAIVQWNFKLI